MNQVRSLASTTHNNGTLQYFALDFGVSHAGYHGSHVILQAIFLNEALTKIKEIYTKKLSHGQKIGHY